MPLPRFKATAVLSVIAGLLMVAGLLAIVLYAYATPGLHVRYLSVGLLAAFAAFAVGSLAGFLFGIPRAVSSGALRHLTSELPSPQPSVTPSGGAPATAVTGAGAGGTPLTTAGAPTGETPVAGAPSAVSGGAPVGSLSTGQAPRGRFSPSTNLAEVSDWLTKLLLGAGLVGLTHLGGPAGGLIDAVARGLQRPDVSTDGPAQLMAGALLLAYGTLGFLSGYVVTTTWYSRKLDSL